MDVLRGPLQGCDYCEVPWRGQAPSLRNQWVRMRRGAQCAPGELSDSARLHGASRTPPPTAYMQTSVYPWRADGEHRPLQNEGRGHLAPEGSIGRGRKGVKKNAALLHFLAFAFSDHIIGVPRGEQPLGRASRAVGSSGTLFGSFWGSKRNTWRENPMIRGGTARWCPRQARNDTKTRKKILQFPRASCMI